MEKFLRAGWNFLEKMIYFFGVKVFRIRLLENNWDSIIQFVKFGVVGLSNTVVSYVIYLISLLLLQNYALIPNFDYLVAQFIGFLISVLWSFYWNRKYVFKADNDQVPWPQALLKTYISYGFTGIFLNSILSILWVQMLGVSKLIAPIFNLIISVPLNFILNKFWAFRKGK
ncbi:MAG: GtrA family protein [Lachnospiraceae bacterium]|nr:GtrA family protein [Lachnospiraceae bacterium]